MPTKRTREGPKTNSSHSSRYGASPFRKIEQLADQLGKCFQKLCNPGEIASNEIADLGRQLCRLNRKHTDACLASVHVLGSRSHASLHPIFSVFLAELIADALDFNTEQHRLLCNAAVTANLGMYEYHEQWASQEGPLTRQQRHLRDRHPMISVERLRAAGVDDQNWLDIVLQHHELVDGSGYPNGISGNDIRRESLILAVVDRYLAFVLPRLPRDRVHPTTALQHIYRDSGIYDESVIAAFVKQLGIYPPGTSVRLLNGDIAVVTHRRIGDSVHPKVVSVGNGGDMPYAEPVPRDTTLDEYAIRDLYTAGERENLVSPAWIQRHWPGDDEL